MSEAQLQPVVGPRGSDSTKPSEAASATGAESEVAATGGTPAPAGTMIGIAGKDFMAMARQKAQERKAAAAAASAKQQQRQQQQQVQEEEGEDQDQDPSGGEAIASSTTGRKGGRRKSTASTSKEGSAARRGRQRKIQSDSESEPDQDDEESQGDESSEAYDEDIARSTKTMTRPSRQTRQRARKPRRITEEDSSSNDDSSIEIGGDDREEVSGSAESDGSDEDGEKNNQEPAEGRSRGRRRRASAAPTAPPSPPPARRTSARLKTLAEALPSTVEFGTVLDTNSNVAPMFLEPSARRTQLSRMTSSSSSVKNSAAGDVAITGSKNVGARSSVARPPPAAPVELSGVIEGFQMGDTAAQSAEKPGAPKRSFFDISLQVAVQSALQSPAAKGFSTPDESDTSRGISLLDSYLRSDISPYYYLRDSIRSQSSFAGKYAFDVTLTTTHDTKEVATQAGPWEDATIAHPLPLSSLLHPETTRNEPAMSDSPRALDCVKPSTSQTFSLVYNREDIKSPASRHHDTKPSRSAGRSEPIVLYDMTSDDKPLLKQSPAFASGRSEVLLSEGFVNDLADALQVVMKSRSIQERPPTSSAISDLLLQFLLVFNNELGVTSAVWRDAFSSIYSSLKSKGHQFAEAPTLPELCTDRETAWEVCQQLSKGSFYMDTSYDIQSNMLSILVQTLPTYATAVQATRDFLRNFTPGLSQPQQTGQPMSKRRNLFSAKPNSKKPTYDSESSDSFESASESETEAIDSSYFVDTNATRCNPFNAVREYLSTESSDKQRRSVFLAPPVQPSTTVALCLHGSERVPLSTIVMAACTRTHKTLEVNATSRRGYKEILDVCAEATQSHIVASTTRASTTEAKIFDTLDVEKRELDKARAEAEKASRATRGVLGMFAAFQKKGAPPGSETSMAAASERSSATANTAASRTRRSKAAKDDGDDEIETVAVLTNSKQMPSAEPPTSPISTIPRLTTAIYFEDMDLDYAALAAFDAAVTQSASSTAPVSPLKIGQYALAGTSSATASVTVPGAVRALQTLISTAKRPILVAVPTVAPPLALFAPETELALWPQARGATTGFYLVPSPSKWETLLGLVLASLFGGHIPNTSMYRELPDRRARLTAMVHHLAELAAFTNWDLRCALAQLQLVDVVQDTAFDLLLANSAPSSATPSIDQWALVPTLRVARPISLMPALLSKALETSPTFVPRMQYFLPFVLKRLGSRSGEAVQGICELTPSNVLAAMGLGSKLSSLAMETLCGSKTRPDKSGSVNPLVLQQSFQDLATGSETSADLLAHLNLVSMQDVPTTSSGFRSASHNGPVSGTSRQTHSVPIRVRNVRVHIELVPSQVPSLSYPSWDTLATQSSPIVFSVCLAAAMPAQSAELASIAILDDSGRDVSCVLNIIPVTGVLAFPENYAELLGAALARQAESPLPLTVSLACVTRLTQEIFTDSLEDPPLPVAEKLLKLARAVLSAATSNLDLLEVCGQAARLGSSIIRQKQLTTNFLRRFGAAYYEWLVEEPEQGSNSLSEECPDAFNADQASASILSRCAWKRVNLDFAPLGLVPEDPLALLVQSLQESQAIPQGAALHAPGLDLAYQRLRSTLFPSWLIKQAPRAPLDLCDESDEEFNGPAKLPPNSSETSSWTDQTSQLGQKRPNERVSDRPDEPQDKRIQLDDDIKGDVRFLNATQQPQVCSTPEFIEDTLANLAYLADTISFSDMLIAARAPPALCFGRPRGLAMQPRRRFAHAHTLARLMLTGGIEAQAAQPLPSAAELPPAPLFGSAASQAGQGDNDSRYVGPVDGAGLGGCLGPYSGGLLYVSNRTSGDITSECVLSLESEDLAEGRGPTYLPAPVIDVVVPAQLAIDTTNLLLGLGFALLKPGIQAPQTQQQWSRVPSRSSMLIRSFVDLSLCSRAISSVLPATMRNVSFVPTWAASGGDPRSGSNAAFSVSTALLRRNGKSAFASASDDPEIETGVSLNHLYAALSTDPRSCLPFLKASVLCHETLEVLRKICQSEAQRIAEAENDRQQAIASGRMRAARARVLYGGSMGLHRLKDSLSKHEITWILHS